MNFVGVQRGAGERERVRLLKELTLLSFLFVRLSPSATPFPLWVSLPHASLRFPDRRPPPAQPLAPSSRRCEQLEPTSFFFSRL